MEHPGVVEQHIDLAEALERLFNSLTAIFSNTHIRTYEQSLAASRDDVLHNLLATLGVAAGNRDHCTLAGETYGGCAADSRGSAGYQGYFSFQSHLQNLLNLLIHAPTGCKVLQWSQHRP